MRPGPGSEPGVTRSFGGGGRRYRGLRGRHPAGTNGRWRRRGARAGDVGLGELRLPGDSSVQAYGQSGAAASGGDLEVVGQFRL